MPRFTIEEFRGGKNNFLSPHLIKANEAQELKGAFIEDGRLTPLAGLKKSADPVIGELSYQNGNRSIVKFGDEYFWTDNVTGEPSSTVGYVGITPPDTGDNIDGFRARPGLIGDRFEGEYRYLIQFFDGKFTRSAPYLPNNRSNNIVTILAEISQTALQLKEYPEFTWTRSTAFDASISKGDGRVKVYPAGNIVNYAGRNWRARANVSIVVNRIENKPLLISKWAEPSLEEGNHWEDVTGTTINVTGFNSIILSNFPRPIESGVKFITIYRTIANGNDFYELDEIEVGTAVYEDFTRDAELVNNRLLGSEFSFPPVYEISGNSWSRVNAKYLTKVQNRYWWAVDNKAYHSPSRDIHNVNPSHVVQFEGEITAMWEFAGGLLVWPTDSKPHLLTGNVEDGTLQDFDFSTTQGNPNWKTTANVFNFPVWQSYDGICVIQKGPTGVGPSIHVVTEERYKFSSLGNFALGHKGVYYLFFDNEVVAFDFQKNQIYNFEATVDYGFSSRDKDQMYLVSKNQIYKLGGGDLFEMVYKSPEFRGPESADMKIFDNFQIRTTPPFKYSVFYEKTPVILNKESKNTFVSLPCKATKSIELEIKTSNPVSGYSIDYEVA